MWKGKAKVLNGAPNPENLVAADWYNPIPDGNGLTLDPPPNGEEAWHLESKYCFKVNPRGTTNEVISNPTQDTYLVMGIDPDGNKIKLSPVDILLDEEDM